MATTTEKHCPKCSYTTDDKLKIYCPDCLKYRHEWVELERCCEDQLIYDMSNM